MKCLLCKGRKTFFVFRKNNEFHYLLGTTDYKVDVECPRCKGTGTEKYINNPSTRMRESMASYCLNYKDFFALEYKEPFYKKILKYL